MAHKFLNSPNRSNRNYSRSLRTAPKILVIGGGILLLIVLLIIVFILLPLLAGLAGAILNGDVTSWLNNFSKTLQDTIKPFTDILNVFQSLSSEGN